MQFAFPLGLKTLLFFFLFKPQFICSLSSVKAERSYDSAHGGGSSLKTRQVYTKPWIRPPRSTRMGGLYSEKL